jgi:hypothetical protein
MSDLSPEAIKQALERALSEIQRLRDEVTRHQAARQYLVERLAEARLRGMPNE